MERGQGKPSPYETCERCRSRNYKSGSYRDRSPKAGCARIQWQVNPVVTVKLELLLPMPSTVTVTANVPGAITGAKTTMLVALQETTVAWTPFTVTVLPPCVEPKPTPPRVIGVCGSPELGDKELIWGLITWFKTDEALGL